MKKKKHIALFIIMLVAIIMAVPNVYAISTNSFYKATRTDATKLSTSTNSLVHHNETIPSEYSLELGEAYKTYHSDGCTNRLTAAEKQVYKNSSSEANKEIIKDDTCKAENSIKGKYNMIYKNIGTYNGKDIDVKLTIMDFSLNDHYLSSRGVGVVGFYNGTAYNDPNDVDQNTGLLGVTTIGAEWVEVKYEFFESGTSNKIKVKGFTNYWDVDSWQGVYFEDGYKGIYASDKTALYYNEVEGNPFISAPNGGISATTHYNPKGHFAETFEADTMTIVYSFARPDNGQDSSTAIEFANGGIWHSAVVSNARKSYAKDTLAGKDNSAVKVGDKIKYEIHFTNGDETSEAEITITDTLSKGLTYNNDAKIGNTAIALKDGYPKVNEPTGVTTLAWETTLPKDSSATLVYSVTVNENAQSMVNNGAIVNIGTEKYTLSELKNPVPTKQYASDTPSGKNGVAVKKGDTIKYSIKYGNATNSSAKITITDTLSTGLTYKKGSAKVGGTAIADPTISGNTLTFTRASVAANTSEELTYEVTVTGTTPIVQNNAKISYNDGPMVDLNILKNPVPIKEYGGKGLSDNPGWNHAKVNIGDNIKYKIRIANTKDTEKTVVIKDVLSKGLTYNKDVKISAGTITNTDIQADTSNSTTTIVIVATIPAGQVADVT